MYLSAVYAALVLSMVPINEKHLVIAWSPDGTKLAVRYETQHEMSGDEPGSEYAVPILTINVLQCGREKPFKVFPVTTKTAYKPIHRKRGWLKAEKWLKQQGYIFTAGSNAKKVGIALTKAEKAKSDALVHIPIPQALVTRHKLEKAYLKLWVPSSTPADAHISVDAVFTRKGKAQKATATVLYPRIHSSLYQWSCKEYAYGPQGVCMAFICTEPGPMASTFSSLLTVPMEKVEKQLKP